MTSYVFTEDELKREIKAIDPSWLNRTQALTGQLRQKGRYEGSGNAWSKVKRVWVRLQRQKCAYCECKYGNEEYALINFDVKHYRPKSSVKEWPSPVDKKENPNLAYDFPTGDPSSIGYYLLAYSISNYAVACKECNTIFKSSCFPIYGQRQVTTEDPAILRSEEPLLLFPIGAEADDPAAFIKFEGIIPVPAQSADVGFRRARVTIDLFKLDYREELLRERCFLALQSLLRIGAGDIAEPDPFGDRPKQPHLAAIERPSPSRLHSRFRETLPTRPGGRRKDRSRGIHAPRKCGLRRHGFSRCRQRVMLTMTVKIIEGDLLDQPVDAIVNAWNRNTIPWWLLLPQGVSGAIKRRGGTGPFREVARHGRLALGQAVATPAGKLPHRGIIHVAGINDFWRASERSIRDSVRNALTVAGQNGWRTLAFPILGAGSGGFDAAKAEAIMRDELEKSYEDLHVILVRFRRS